MQLKTVPKEFSLTFLGHYDAVVALVRAGADVNACDRTGQCPIHFSVKDKFYPAVECLLMAGADPNKRVHLTTPLHIAAELGDSKLVRLLLLHGAFPSPTDARGFKPIDLVDKDSSLYKLISAYMGWVPSLQFLSRLAIKRQIPSLLHAHVSCLDLPGLLCDYLTFKF
uniref:SOCS box domain-containing protein n=1 Tax=Mesocestoides corti TaxID=53468 RepID=A0A5K3FKB6_MESCO